MAKRKKPTKGQGELGGMPDKGPVVKKALAYLDIKDELDSMKLKSDAAKKELIEVFIKEGQTSIKIEGVTIFYSHLETDQIKVKQSE